MSILKIFTDGGSRGNPGIAGLGVNIEDESGETQEQISIYLGIKTNNEAEYRGLITALDWIIEHSVKNTDLTTCYIFMDSKLVVEQINQRWQIKQDHLLALARQAWEQIEVIKGKQIELEISYIPRELNKKADQLANQAMDKQR